MTSPAPTERFFADYPVGSVWELGSVALSEAEIVEFARRYDPQPFHVDAAAAAASPFGGLIASGWQTCAAMMRLLVEGFLSPASSLGSPGVDELRWLRPMRPDVGHALRAEVIEARVSRSRPDRGLIRTRLELTDPTGAVVLSVVAWNLIRRGAGQG